MGGRPCCRKADLIWGGSRVIYGVGEVGESRSVFGDGVLLPFEAGSAPRKGSSHQLRNLFNPFFRKLLKFTNGAKSKRIDRDSESG